MFKIDENRTIHITRGDMAPLEIIGIIRDTEEPYVFKTGEIVRLRVFSKRNPNNVVLQKDEKVVGDTAVVDMLLSREDTKIGDFINKPKDYWYEIEVNPDTAPQTIVGYDEDGPKIFRLYPEGSDRSEF